MELQGFLLGGLLGWAMSCVARVWQHLGYQKEMEASTLLRDVFLYTIYYTLGFGFVTIAIFGGYVK